MALNGSGWAESAEAWIRFVDRGDPSRQAILDGPVMEACDLRPGLALLDVGCGEGRFCRMASDRGAMAVGIDPTAPLVREAGLRHQGSSYAQARAECLPFRDRSFDRVVSYLTLIDIPDYRAAIREMARVLKPGGTLVAANLNGFVTAQPWGWRRDGEGRALYYPLDQYGFEHAETVAWSGIKVVNWHRPLGHYMAAFLGGGLVLERFEEPLPNAAMLEANPRLQEDVRVPLFHVAVWRKPRA